MISDVKFYRLPGSLSGNEYPVIENGQTIASYLIHTAQDAKVTHDLSMGITVPIFTGYDNVNMAEIDGSFYWVVDYNTRTLQEVELVTFGLIYNSPTSQLTIGDTMTGVFTRTPSQYQEYLQQAVSNDVMEFSRAVELSHITPAYYKNSDGTYRYQDRRVYWVEVVLTINPTNRGGTSTHKIGFFAVDPILANSIQDRIHYAIRYGGADHYLGYTTIRNIMAPSVLAGTTGWTATEVIQISISERCPYAYTVTEHTDSSGNKYPLYNLDNHTPAEDVNTAYPGYYLDMYETPSSESIELELSEMERAIGSVRVVNESGEAIATIPTQYTDEIECEVRTFSDYSGIFTEVLFNNRVVTILNEGHIPYIGNAWDEYQAYNQQYDREQTNIAKFQNSAEMGVQMELMTSTHQIQQIGNAANAVLGAITNPAGAIGTLGGAAINAITSGAELRAQYHALDMSAKVKNMTLDFQQRATEKHMQAAPGSAYNMGYGLIYIHNCENHPANLRLEMPSNVTSDYYDAYISEFGYPAEGKQTIDVEAGFVQGRLVNDGTMTGAKFDDLNSVLMSGIKIIGIGDN